MKKIAITCCILMIAFSGFTQDTLSTRELRFEIGSYRNKYLYPISNIKYYSNLLTNVNLNFSTELRCYGSWYIIHEDAYDLTPIVQYYFTNEASPFNASAGVGLNARLRMVNDVRSEAESSVEPLVNISLYSYVKQCTFHIGNWARFYANGIAYTFLPEFNYTFDNGFGIVCRYELTYLKIYNTDVNDWQRDCFFGVNYHF